MRIMLQCMQCLIENGGADPVSYAADWLDDGTAKTKCRNGHIVRNTILAEKYEFLAESAISAILDGYYREAISAFSSSLERFYEFYLEIISHSNDLGESHDAAWKQIKNQSERQLGAYIFTFLNEEGEMPKLLEQKHVTLRNKVIHKGYIPTLKETIDFGNSIIDVVRSGRSRLEDTKVEFLRARSLNKQREPKESIPGEYPSTYVKSSIYSKSKLCEMEKKLVFQTLEEWIEIEKCARNAYLKHAPTFEVAGD